MLIVISVFGFVIDSNRVFIVTMESDLYYSRRISRMYVLCDSLVFFSTFSQ